MGKSHGLGLNLDVSFHGVSLPDLGDRGLQNPAQPQEDTLSHLKAEGLTSPFPVLAPNLRLPSLRFGPHQNQESVSDLLGTVNSIYDPKSWEDRSPDLPPLCLPRGALMLYYDWSQQTISSRFVVLPSDCHSHSN